MNPAARRGAGLYRYARHAGVVGALIGHAAAAAGAQSARRVTRLAPGVWSIEHRDNGDGVASGNTTVIVGRRQVLVVDAGFLPSSAREDIARIRTWTDKPVTFLLNTHFHNDHNFGNRIYLDTFPALTIIAHAETKADMDRYGPGSADRGERENGRLRRMLETGKTPGGHTLAADDSARVRAALARRATIMDEIRDVRFQSATLTFTDSLTIDLGDRVARVLFLGRGNTTGDAVVWLPAERIVVSGDLVVWPIPYIYDGYPVEWTRTLDRLMALGATTIVPGHGPVLRDDAYVRLERDLLQSAVDQVDARLRQIGPALAHTVDDVRGSVDLSAFKPRFAGSDPERGAAFDDMAASLVRLVFREASLR